MHRTLDDSDAEDATSHSSPTHSAVNPVELDNKLAEAVVWLHVADPSIDQSSSGNEEPEYSQGADFLHKPSALRALKGFIKLEADKRNFIASLPAKIKKSASNSGLRKPPPKKVPRRDTNGEDEDYEEYKSTDEEAGPSAATKRARETEHVRQWQAILEDQLYLERRLDAEEVNIMDAAKPFQNDQADLDEEDPDPLELTLKELLKTKAKLFTLISRTLCSSETLVFKKETLKQAEQFLRDSNKK